MGLDWIAAVLRPRDVAPHPNFSEEQADSAVKQFASLLAGPQWWPPALRFPGLQDQLDPTVRLVYRALYGHEIPQLLRELQALDGDDEGRLCALTLIGCFIAADSDDYDIIFTLLDRALSADEASSADSRLIRALLLQQRALRRQDAGLLGADDAIEAYHLLRTLDVDQLSSFDVSVGVSWSSAVSVREIVEFQRQAALSLLDPDAPVPDDHALPVWVARVQSLSSPQLLMISTRRAEAYRTLMSSMFEEEMQSGGHRMIQQPDNDLFFPTLLLEVSGHSSVRSARSELARQRFLDAASGGERTGLSDALRLLRHAGEIKQVQMASAWLRKGGPLMALGEDARRVLRRVSNSAQLRGQELIVLTHSADLLAQPEATQALGALVDAAGSFVITPDAPGHHEAGFQHLERAYQCAVRLAPTAQAGHTVLGWLGKELQQRIPDPLTDRALARAVDTLLREEGLTGDALSDWPVSDSSELAQWPETSGVIRQYRGSDAAMGSLDDVARELNRVIRDSRLDFRGSKEASRIVQQALARISDEAEQESYLFGGVLASDLAAALIAHARCDELWGPLSRFLCNPAIPRSQKSSAFDRLAASELDLPAEVQDLFPQAASNLLHDQDPLLERGETQLNPYPAALRFLAANGFIDSASLISETGRLAGTAEGVARVEASYTLAVLTSRRPDIWQGPMALQLSHDLVADVRARAGAALVNLLKHVEPWVGFRATSIGRIIELLEEDGLLVPLHVANSLRGFDELPRAITQELRELRDSHPSRVLRQATNGVLQASG